MAAKPVLELATRLIDYDPLTGVARWAVCRGGRGAKGREVGKVNRKGYMVTVIQGKEYLVHRLVWAVAHQKEPAAIIDHINGVKTDNRLCNLRCVDAPTNQQNRHVASRSSRSGRLGVSFCNQTGKWKAAIRNPQTQTSLTLGRFADLDSASAAYSKAKSLLHPGHVPVHSGV